MPTDPNTTPPVVERYGPWVALYAAIALTASGEFQLAALVGFPSWIAWALPTAIDVYVVQAMRRHRDVAGALVLMVATNAIYHLAASGLFGVTGSGQPLWWLIVLVAAIAPVIVWRVHRITEPRIPLAATSDRQEPASTAPTALPPTDNTAPLPAAPVAPTVTPAPAPVADNTPTTADSSDRQQAPTTPAPADSKPARKPPAPPRQRPGKRAPRRSMDDWVILAGPIFHAEFARLRRQPTANEFATAIDAAGLGKVSDSTAKNIRTEILDRTDVPALDQTD